MQAARTQTLLILSDIHYAGAAEQRRGCPELDVISNPLLRLCVRAYRRFIWNRNPFANNYLLDQFLAEAPAADHVIANGDYSCDTAFVGVSDDASCESVKECLAKLRAFEPKLRLVIGDHELGKFSLFGKRGGMRISSCVRAEQELGLEPFWKLKIGKYSLIGVTSSLLAFPILEAESLPEERAAWLNLRDQHFALIREALATLAPNERVLLFCHDPTALPFLWQDQLIRGKLDQVEATIIGHLHSSLILWKSKLLAGMPPVRFLGNSVRRMSTALHQARLWRHFRIKLCPALAGIELLKDGGYYRVFLDPEALSPLRFEFHPLSASLPPRG